jgi:hypothetical protein
VSRFLAINIEGKIGQLTVRRTSSFISARNQDIIMVYEALIKVDIYGVGLANTRAQL